MLKNICNIRYEFRCAYPDILGISYEQFQELFNSASKKHIKIQKEKENQKFRINSPGGGRKELLSISEEICLCIFYLRQIPTFEIIGMLFGVSKSKAHATFHYWRKVIREILPSSLIEQVDKQEGDLMIVKI